MSNQYQKLKKQHYLSLLQECARSGKNKREWCAQAGVKYSTLMRWQGLLRDELAGEILAAQEIVPVQVELPEQVSRQSAETLPANSASAV
ncbi:IS66 family insertion sequence element accessory protein TnpA, partial [Faecalibacterium sp. An121]|uniref:IS66 family insertion sequence element accessory protein TnpA n=1 Tax=Faecalibacterium sp. An121 TaxID=1965550 RepID=UPI000B578C15